MKHEGPITILMEDNYSGNRRFGLHHPDCRHLEMATAKAEKHGHDAFHYDVANPKEVLVMLADQSEMLAFECDKEYLIKWKEKMQKNVGVQDGWKTIAEDFIDLNIALPPCLDHTVHRAIEAEFTHEFIEQMCHNWKWIK